MGGATRYILFIIVFAFIASYAVWFVLNMMDEKRKKRAEEEAKKNKKKAK